MSEQAPAPQETPPEHEARDVSFWGVARVALALIVALIVILLLVLALHHSYDKRRPLSGRDTQSIEDMVETTPRLETDPRADLLTLREREETILSTYAWVDRGRGIVRVPIERAMELLAQPGNTQ